MSFEMLNKSGLPFNLEVKGFALLLVYLFVRRKWSNLRGVKFVGKDLQSSQVIIIKQRQERKWWSEGKENWDRLYSLHFFGNFLYYHVGVNLVAKI